jgi:transglutaminase-like putative cysteine protease
MAAFELKSPLLTRARRSEKLVILLLLFVLLTAATAGVTSILIGPDWGLLWRGLTFGLLTGWVLAILWQPAWRAGLITSAVGAAYALLFAGGLRERISAIFIELVSIASRIAASPKDPEIDLASLTRLLQDLLNAAGVVVERVNVWIMALILGDPVFDPVAAALVWSIMVWIIAAWAGWVVEARQSALLASLPALMLSLGTLSYGRSESTALYFMLGSVLLLMATVQFDWQRQAWEKAEVTYPPRKGRQVGNTAAIVVVALVALSAIVSSLSLPRIVEWVSEQTGNSPQQEGDLAKSLGIIAAATASPDSFEDVRRPGLPRELLIGSGPELSHRWVMTVAIEDFPSILKGEQLSPLYWRSLTYDVYTGHGWRTSSTSLSEYQANQPLQPPQAPYHILIRQTVRSIGQKSSTLYVAGEPVAINQPSETARRSIGDLFGVQIGSTMGYTASSLLPVVDEATLRSAGQDYPDWVKHRFLSIPAEVPTRIKDLAIQLTAAEPTPYDRARAIERYLRTIPYTLDVPHPPPDQDLVDFFLFNLRKGYCDYYASAMVVLARAAGVPTRIAIGYANGTYDLNSRRFQVTEADAHSWVEVYFPNIGWVAFEPTAGRPALEIDQSLGQTVTQDLTTNIVSTDTNHPGLIPNMRLILLGGLLGAGVLGLILFAIDEIRLCRLPEPEAAAEVYRRMRRYGARLAVAMTPGDTPYEFTASLGSRLQELSFYKKKPGLAANLPADVDTITDEIVQASYHPLPPQGKATKTLYSQWRILRWRLSMMWFMMHYKYLHDRLSQLLVGGFSDKQTESKQEG